MNLKSLKHYDEFFICAYCAYCVDNNAACPTFLSTYHEISTGRGKMITARNLAQGYLNDKEGLDALTEGLFQCTFCGACEQECIVNIPLTEVYSELKTLIQDRLPKIVLQMYRNLKRSNNFYGMDQEDRNFWNIEVEDIYNEWVNQPAEFGYFIGCVGSYAYLASETPVAILKLTKQADERISIFSPTEYCCGNPFLLGGNIENAMEFAKHNVTEIEKLGIKNLIVSCAGCYRVFSKEYPRILAKELPFKVITHMEFILNLIKAKKLRFLNDSPVKVSFKDPCELGRHCDVYDVARDLINSLPGVKNLELTNNRQNALCCGAGGLLKATNPNIAGEITHRLIKQMEEKGTELCLNSCPSCLVQIDQHLKKIQSPIKSMDITQLVLDRTTPP
ncbi:MAG: (Fe-S)-binding protein [Candidatus Hodarchaeota archaeon]